MTPPTAQGAPGDILRTFDAEVPSCSLGVGLAFDRSQLIVSCNGYNELWGVSPEDGSLQTTYTITGAPYGFGAMAWDSANQTLWACGDFSDDGSVYKINLATQEAIEQFDVAGCVDGLAYDGTDNTVWASPDVSDVIYHYTVDGTLIFEHDFNGAMGCGNSGVAAGAEKLFLANNGCSEIYSMNKDGSGIAKLGGYPARLEDLECDDVTFPGKVVIWSKDAYDPTLNAFDAGDINCGVDAYKDSDRDGIRDDWEEYGADLDGDGSVDLDLPAMGSDPDHADLFVEIDWLTKDDNKIGPISIGGGFAYPPSIAATSRVVSAFKNWPVPNPDGEQGINLHLDAGPESVMDPASGDTWGSGSRANAIRNGTRFPDWTSWSQLDTFRMTNVDWERRAIFHYVLYVDELGCSPNGCVTGWSRGIPGHDLLLARGKIATDTQEAVTLAHELGHNLGLGHGGRRRTDDPGSQFVNNKANYLSIMNYYYSNTGLVSNSGIDAKDGIIGFSPQEHAPLDTENLNELGGLSPDPFAHLRAYYKCDNSGQPFGDTGKVYGDTWAAINWNCDGATANGSSNSYLQNPSDVARFDADSSQVLGSEDYHHLLFWGNGKSWDDRNASIVEFDQPGTAEPTVEEAKADGVWWPQRSLQTQSNIEITVYPNTGTVSIPLRLANPGTSAFSISPELASADPGFSFASTTSITLAPGASETLNLNVDTGQVPATSNASALVKFVDTSEAVLGSINVLVRAAETGPTPTACTEAADARSAPGVAPEQVPALDAFLARCSFSNGASDAASPLPQMSGGPDRGRAIADRIARVRGRWAILRLRCQGEARCHGVAKLIARIKSKRAVKRRGNRHLKRGARNVVIGKGRFNIAPRKAGVLRIRLTSAGRKLLRRSGRRGLRVRLIGHGLKGGMVTLKPQKDKKRRRSKQASAQAVPTLKQTCVKAGTAKPKVQEAWVRHPGDRKTQSMFVEADWRMLRVYRVSVKVKSYSRPPQPDHPKRGALQGPC